MSQKFSKARGKYRSGGKLKKGKRKGQPPLLKALQVIPKPALSPAKLSPPPTVELLETRYQYVTRDLRYIGILTGAILVILIILTFVLD